MGVAYLGVRLAYSVKLAAKKKDRTGSSRRRKSSEFQKSIPPCKIDDIPERLVGFCSLLRTSTSPQTRRLRSFLSYSGSDDPYRRPCRRNLYKNCLDASSDPPLIFNGIFNTAIIVEGGGGGISRCPGEVYPFG